MPIEASELVRLDRREIDLIFKYRRCNIERQDVIQYVADELAKHAKPAHQNLHKSGNVIHLADLKAV